MLRSSQGCLVKIVEEKDKLMLHEILFYLFSFSFSPSHPHSLKIKATLFFQCVHFQKHINQFFFQSNCVHYEEFRIFSYSLSLNFLEQSSAVAINRDLMYRF